MKQRVPEEAAGQRLDRYLASLPEVGSRSVAERLLGSESVRIDGRPEGKSHRLAGGEEVEFEPPETERPSLAPEAMELRIAYEDEHLVVVDKPAGLVVHPAPGHASGTLVHGLLEHAVAGGDADRPGIVHRLDRDTSGLMVAARSEEAHRRLQNLVRTRALERHYIALVVGLPRSRSGRIEAPIGRDRRDPLRHSLDSDTPRDAVTHFEVLELLPRHALLDVRLETPDGVRLIARGSVILRSSAVSTVALLVVAGSTLFLLLAWARRTRRRTKAAARATPATPPADTA